MRHAVLTAGALALLLSACTKEARDPGAQEPSPSPVESTPPVVAAPTVSAILASVTLADDCGKTAAAGGSGSVASADAPMPPRAGTMTVPKAGKAARCAGPNCGTGFAPRRKICQQTTMQLALTASAGKDDSNIEIVKVELLDEATKAPLGELISRRPMLWENGVYRDWDGKLAPGAAAKTSFELSAPDWSKLGGSREAASGKTFLMRVTLRVNGQETTADKTVQSAPVMVEPHMVT